MPYKPPAIQTNLNRNSSIIRKTGKNKNQPVKQFESPKNKQAVTKRKAIYKFRLLIKLSKLIFMDIMKYRIIQILELELNEKLQ